MNTKITQLGKPAMRDIRLALQVELMQALEDLGFAFIAPAKYVYVKAEASA